MLNRQFYTPVLADMKRRRDVLDSAIAALESLMTPYHYCEPLKAEHLLPFAGKWIAVDRSGEQEMIIASGDTRTEAAEAANNREDVVLQEVWGIQNASESERVGAVA